MIIEGLPTTGWITLESSKERKRKWEYLIKKGCSVHTAGSIEFENVKIGEVKFGSEKIRVDILITDIFSPSSLEKEVFYTKFYNLGDRCYKFLKSSLNQDARAYEGYLIYEGKKILMVIVEYVELEKVAYFFDASKKCLYFPRRNQN